MYWYTHALHVFDFPIINMLMLVINPSIKLNPCKNLKSLVFEC